MNRRGSFELALPLLLALVGLLAWEGLVRALAIPSFVLPPPSSIVAALVGDFASLARSALVTLAMTTLAFAAAVVFGVGFAVLFCQSEWLERALYPYAVVLQVTPIVAIAPLVVIWVGIDHPDRAVFILATIVAFFPVLSNTVLGLKSADRNLHALFRLYGASRWQTLVKLQLPSALPLLLGGAKISGGLALIGAVVAEFVAASGASSGLAWRIAEAGNRLQVAKMFAALAMLSAVGIGIHTGLAWLERRLLHRWHESALPRAEE